MIKVLIADDEVNILMLTEMLFKDADMTVVTASNGEEAIELALKERPDLIISDVIMPKKTGHDVCKFIKSHNELRHTPIILLSAMGDEYNKLTGFAEGADDYVTKPFNVDELKARAKALLNRYKATTIPVASPSPELLFQDQQIPLIPTHIPALNTALNGGLPKGSNILLTGPLGTGKSFFSRQFIADGLSSSGERSLFVAIDDNPKHIRQHLAPLLTRPVKEYEDSKLIRFVDAYSWSTFQQPEDELFYISGMLELNHLSGVISDASYELGQTIQHKCGGRRVVDSISSLLINFEISSAQRFISQIARTAVSFGDVTTLFIIESGAVDSQALNNIKYVMDGVLEFDVVDGKKSIRVASMKWTQSQSEWVGID